MVHIQDDFIVFGNDNTEHDRILENLLQRFRECGLTFNPKKCKFRLPQIEFFGFVSSKDGMKPWPSKVKALKQMDPPRNVSKVCSLLGMVQYSARFISNFTRMTTPSASSPTKGSNGVCRAQSKQHLTNSRTRYLVTLSSGTMKQAWKEGSLWTPAPTVLN